MQKDQRNNLSLLALDDGKALDTRMVISPWVVSFYAEEISLTASVEIALLWLIWGTLVWAEFVSVRELVQIQARAERRTPPIVGPLNPVEHNIVKRPTTWPCWRGWSRSIDFREISPRNWTQAGAAFSAERV